MILGVSVGASLWLGRRGSRGFRSLTPLCCFYSLQTHSRAEAAPAAGSNLWLGASQASVCGQSWRLLPLRSCGPEQRAVHRKNHSSEHRKRLVLIDVDAIFSISFSPAQVGSPISRTNIIHPHVYVSLTSAV